MIDTTVTPVSATLQPLFVCFVLLNAQDMNREFVLRFLSDAFCFGALQRADRVQARDRARFLTVET